jgi:hypothetical protein
MPKKNRFENIKRDALNKPKSQGSRGFGEARGAMGPAA